MTEGPGSTEAPPGLSRRLLLDCVLSDPKLVQRVELREITLGAGVPIGAHRHPCPVFGQVLAGRIVFQVQGEQSRELGPGDAFHEPANTPILHFDAIEERATFVACFLLGDGEENVLEMLA